MMIFLYTSARMKHEWDNENAIREQSEDELKFFC